MADMDKRTDVVEEAAKRFDLINGADKENRDNYKADLAFVYSPGAQWPDSVRATRTSWKELCLEFNQLKQFVAQVVNDQLQNRPGVRVHPAGGDASEEVAEVLQGMIRAIEYDSKADDIYKLAFKLAVSAGRGWWRVVSEYEADDEFTQKLCIKPIQDSNTVYADTDYQMPDGSDRSYVFVVERYTKEEFERKWPDADPVSWDKLPPYWSDGKDSVLVADYYRRVCKKRKLVKMSDGAVGWFDEMPTPPAGVTIAAERDVDQWKVEWYTIAGGEQILATHEWPGTVIPVVCTPGEDIILDGKRVYQGLTRHARDAQAMLNFGMTQQASQLALSPRAPWVMAEGQNEGYEEMWRDANTKNWSALVYKPVTIDGQVAPPPQRTQPAMVSDGWDRWCQTMIQMIKSTIGMYEQSLGQRGIETSGRAIMAREKQGDTATFNFVNNWHMAIDLTGRILVECMPTYYDSDRIVATIGEDDTKRMVRINQPALDTNGEALQAIRERDITKGRYAVTIEAGPSFATKREETRESLTAFVQAFPPAAQVAGDLIVKAMDLADSEVLAKRLKLTLPLQIRQAEEAEEQGRPAPDPQAMAEMQALQGHLQQAQATMEAMDAKIKELESGAKSTVEKARIEVELKAYLADLEAQAKAAQAEREHQLAMARNITEARVALEKAQIDAQAKVDVARIGQQTDLMIAANQPQEQAEEAEEKPDRIAEVLAELSQSIAALGKPRRRVLERGPDGRAIGMIEVTED